MSQHFLLSAKARTLSLKKVMRMSDVEADQAFRELRWVHTDGEPVCPHCGSLTCYEYRSRPVFKCKDCGKQFSVTSGTIFSGRKLPVRDYLAAIAIFSNTAKGISALQLSRDLDVQYKTAFVLAHKLREIMGDGRANQPLKGEVEMDGAYFGGYIKPKNWKQDRIDRRLVRHQNGKRRCVFVMRERGGRTVPVVIRYENQSDVSDLVSKMVEPGTVLYADENTAYDALHAQFEVNRINHSESYSDGVACTNGAEGWFSRLRRAEIGQHHHIAGKYLHLYAKEMAYREDTRRVDNGTIFANLIYKALNHPVSRNWKGYWQGNKQPSEILGVA